MARNTLGLFFPITILVLGVSNVFLFMLYLRYIERSKSKVNLDDNKNTPFEVDLTQNKYSPLSKYNYESYGTSAPVSVGIAAITIIGSIVFRSAAVLFAGLSINATIIIYGLYLDTRMQRRVGWNLPVSKRIIISFCGFLSHKSIETILSISLVGILGLFIISMFELFDGLQNKFIEVKILLSPVICLIVGYLITRSLSYSHALFEKFTYDFPKPRQE